MDISYLIRLWKSSNYDEILIQDLPVARGSDKVIVEPTLIFHKDQEIYFGKKLNSYEYLRVVFNNSIFQYVKDDDILIAKVIERW